MSNYLSFIDFIFFVLLITLFFFIAQRIRTLRIDKEKCYKYFVAGMFVKIFGGIAVCLVYIFYYGGGDTLSYYHDNKVMVSFFLEKPLMAFKFTFFPSDSQMFFEFNESTGWLYYYFDEHAVYVVKLTWLLSLFTLNSLIGQTMLLSFVSFFAMWRLYKMFIFEFPTLQKQFAYAILFIPSVAFWGSGLLKDTITLAAVAMFTSSFYFIIQLKRKYVLNFVIMFMAAWVLVNIKPYILFALLPGVMIWLAGFYLAKIENKVVRAAVTPFLMFLCIVLAYFFLDNIGALLGKYSIENVLEKAVVTQRDLKQAYYHGTSFDIGDFDPTLRGVLSKAPVAILSALFRPYIWEASNMAMYVSAMENFFILFFTVYLLIRLQVYNFFKLIFKNHLLFFCVSFSLFFAFSVGLSTPNFGSLVRYKIPAMPFFVASLIITNYYYRLSRISKIYLLDSKRTGN